MFYILFYESEVIICKDFDEVMELIVVGWTFYGYSSTIQLAESLLHECKHYLIEDNKRPYTRRTRNFLGGHSGGTNNEFNH